MTTFTIDSDNNITALAERPAGVDPAQTFSTRQQLAKLTAEWPASRLVEAWNSFAGVAPFDDLKPVNKFTDRHTAVARLWTAVQRLAATPAPQSAAAAPGKAKATKRAKAKGDATAANVARAGSKKAMVLDMLRRPAGATLAEIRKATDWQAHTVRGFLSIHSRKLGLTLESTKGESGERTYRVTA